MSLLSTLFYLVAAVAFIACFCTAAFWGFLWVVQPERYALRLARWLIRSVVALAVLWVAYLLLPAEATA